MRSSALLAALVLAAFATRLAPLVLSPYPYNVDGFSGAAVAERMVAEGAWAAWSYDATMPGAFAVLAAFALVAGVPPLLAAQALFAAIGAAAVLAPAALVRRVTGSEIAGIAAASFLAFYGFFLFYTTAVMKESVGLALLPGIVLLFVLRDPRARAWALALAAAMPLVHHLTALLLDSVLLSLAAGRALAAKSGWRDALFVGVLWIEAFAWFSYAGPARTFLDLVADDAVLLASAVVLAAIGAAYLVANPRRTWTRIGVLAAFPLVAALVLALNAASPVFPLSVPTPRGMLPYAAFGAALLAIGAVGLAPVLAAGGRTAAVGSSLLLGVLAFVAFGLFRGFDLVGFNLVHRTVDYLDVAAALGFGVAAVLGAKRLGGPAFLAVLLAAPALMAGFAVSGAGTLPEDNVTRPAEVAAVDFVATRVPGALETDTQYGAILERYHGRAVSERVGDAVASKRLESVSLLAEKWTDWGVSRWPLGPERLRDGEWKALVADNSLVYAGGDEAGAVVVLLPR